MRLCSLACCRVIGESTTLGSAAWILWIAVRHRLHALSVASGVDVSSPALPTRVNRSAGPNRADKTRQVDSGGYTDHNAATELR